MCEEIKKKAKELSDEEMDKVAGGNVAKIRYINQSMYIELCKSPGMVKSFSLYCAQVHNSCQCYIKAEGKEPKGMICQSCTYHEQRSESISKKDEILKQLKDEHYSIHES